MENCERCQINPAQVRIDSLRNGKRERHLYCRACADELMGGNTEELASAMPGGFGGMFPQLFGSTNDGEPTMSGGRPNRGGAATAQRQRKHSKTPTLDQYGRDLTADARDGKLDPASGREREMRRVLTVLGRRQKNNPVLIGEPGVGKTAIVEGIARKVVDGSVPATLRDVRIISLSIGNLLAGAMYRGQFEERVRSLIEELRQTPDVILFIDELHAVVGAGASEGAVGAADLMKPALARGEIRVIGATTLDEYRKDIEKDVALERRFQPVLVNEPSVEDAIAMLYTVREYYEKHHGVKISDASLDAAVKLSDRYINDRFLPDKAIDAMDEAASSLRLDAMDRGLLGPDAVSALERALTKIQAEKEQAALEEDYERAASLRQNELKLQEKLAEAKGSADEAAALTVTPAHIAQVIELWSGVPVTAMVESERQNLLHLEHDLHERVVGQEEAVSAVAKAIRRSRAGLKDPNRPIGSFLFMGPTGVGKTELARALAATMFGSEENIIRLDMSEYMEGHTVSRLFGSPPGYVGHDEGGQLTEQVRRKPYSVILFDEIEKAHADVFNALLQILDDGRLTDGHGRTVDFKNTVVIMTSNVSVPELKRSNIGFLAPRLGEPTEAEGDERKARAMEGLRRAFRPEFLNRIDQIVVFKELSREQLTQIVDLLLAKVASRLAEQGVTLEFGDDLRDLLMREGFDPEYGARPLRRAIQVLVDDALADALLSGTLASGQTAALSVDAGKVCIEARGEAVVVAA